MENASKALIMAGGILISIIIISLLVKTYGSIGAFQRQKLSEEEIARIEEFNKQFTKYLDQYVYGTEVITVINQITNEKNKDYEIEAIITFQGKYTYKRKIKKFGKEIEEEVTIKPGKDLSITNDDDKANYSFLSDSAISGLKTRAFKCTEIKYDGTTGRVNYIKFVEKQYNDLT